MDISIKWQLPANVELLWRVWGDEHVVYHTGSGDTHLLDSVVASVLYELQESPKTIAELVDPLASVEDLPSEKQEVDLPGIIRQLKQLCLIEACLS